MNKYIDSHGWFSGSEIKRLILNYLNNDKNTILEIGSYEGISSVFFADNLLNNSESTLTCVDPFLSIENNDHGSLLINNEEKNFDYNTSICNNSEKIIIKKITSDEFFKTNTATFNFIYIDGSHECDTITRDMGNSFNCLDSNGIMWMDDYYGGDGIKTKKTMDSFLEKIKGQYILIHQGYQIAIKKI